MERVKNGLFVSVAYKGTLQNGEVFVHQMHTAKGPINVPQHVNVSALNLTDSNANEKIGRIPAIC